MTNVPLWAWIVAAQALLLVLVVFILVDAAVYGVEGRDG